MNLQQAHPVVTTFLGWRLHTRTSPHSNRGFQIQFVQSWRAPDGTGDSSLERQWEREGQTEVTDKTSHPAVYSDRTLWWTFLNVICEYTGSALCVTIKIDLPPRHVSWVIIPSLSHSSQKNVISATTREHPRRNSSWSGETTHHSSPFCSLSSELPTS